MSKYNHSGGSKVDMGYIQNIKDNYPKQYATPKYLLFMEKALNMGLVVKLYKPKKGVSKYVTVYHQNKRFKVRFSNHLPIEELEAKNSCDFFVGVTNFKVTNTNQAWEAMMKHFGLQEPEEADEYYS